MAKSSSIGGIFAELTLRDSKFRKGLSSAGLGLKTFGASAAKYGAMAAAALGAGLAAGTKRTISMGGELSDLSSQTGIAVADLMRIQQAYKDNGKSADDAGKDINKMQRSISDAANGDSAKDPFAEIGISAKELMALNPTEQFFAIGEAIKKIQSPTKQAAAAMDIFGRSGGELLTVFKGADLESINKSLGKMPELMGLFADQFDRVDDLIGRLPNKTDQFFTGFSSGIIENIIPALETVDEMDFTHIGQSIGQSIGDGLMTYISGLAVTLNAAWDTIFEGAEFSEAMSKYAEAQNLINEEQKAVRQARLDEAAYQAARTLEHRSAPNYIEPALIQPAEIKPRTISSPDFKPEFDDYRKRGLSLSANPTEVTEKKQLDIQIKIHRLLEMIEAKNGGLWT